jgi:hypothetical protein
MSLLANITTTTTTKLMSLIILQKRVEIDVQYKLLEPLYLYYIKSLLKISAELNIAHILFCCRIYTHEGINLWY